MPASKPARVEYNDSVDISWGGFSSSKSFEHPKANINNNEAATIFSDLIFMIFLILSFLILNQLLKAKI
jgi:hypothetical protein